MRGKRRGWSLRSWGKGKQAGGDEDGDREGIGDALVSRKAL